MSETIKEISPSSIPVLVVGGNGYLGRHILAHLRQLGYPVRVLVRDPARLNAEQKQDVEVFVGQVTRPETLDRLCDGISVVVSTLGLRSLARKPTPWEVDYLGNLNVLTSARAAGVKHFIFVGVLHGAELRTSIPVLEPREQFVDALRQSDLPWTVIRPTGAFNDMLVIFQQARRGRAFLIGTGEARINPIHPTDIAREVARCIEDASARNRIYDVGGPETFTYTQIAQMAFRALGTQPHITHIAPWLVDGAAQLLQPFNPTAAGFLRFFRRVITIDMVGTATGQVHLGDVFAQVANQSQGTLKEGRQGAF
jgi:uncharacterized protein YbjT (DUF2867 family)